MSQPIPILHEDDHVLVASKPAGLLSVETGGQEGASLPEALLEQGLKVIPVHRLDRDVSGCVLFAKTAAARDALEELFRARALRKIYWALAEGAVQPPNGTYHFPILEEGPIARVSARGKKSQTNYRTLSTFPTSTELEVDLVTGRYNQIRLHFAHAGHPLIGERKYARGQDSSVPIKSRRVALHAWRIAFRHPFTDAAVEVEAPLPDELLAARSEAAAARAKRKRR